MANPTPRPTQPARRPTVSLAERIAKARENARNAAGAVPYYSAEAKERLFNEGTPLYLEDATKGTGKFGAKWELTVRENTPQGDPGIISLAANKYRDALFEELLVLIASEQAPIGPLVLSKTTTMTGQETWDVVEDAR